MIKVLLESPYAGDVERNVEYLKKCLMDSLNRNEAPFASHAIYTFILNDSIEEERLLGINAGLAWKEVADKHVFYIDYGMSTGMKYAEEYAISKNI